MFVFGLFHYKDFIFLSYFHAVASLAKPGTFAGNDAIVAFARNHQLNVVIHQLNAPLRCECFKACSRVVYINLIIVYIKLNNIINMKIFKSEAGENVLNFFSLAILLSCCL